MVGERAGEKTSTAQTGRLPPIVAFTGAAGVGKTLATLWCVAWNKRCNSLLANQLQHSFARNLLNDMPWTEMPFSRAQFFQHSVLKDFGMPRVAMLTPRELLAYVDEFVWTSRISPGFGISMLQTHVETAFTTVLRQAKRDAFVADRQSLGTGRSRARGRLLLALDDLGYEEEAKVVRDYGGVVIRIVRPGFDRPSRLYDGRPAVGEADFTILNDGSIQTFFERLRAVLPHAKQTPNLDLVADRIRFITEDFSGRPPQRHELDGRT